MKNRALHTIILLIVIMLVTSFSEVFAALPGNIQGIDSSLYDNYEGYDEYYQFSTPPSIESTSSILIELDKGQVLYSKEPTKRVHAAVACKLMTSILAIEKLKGKLDSKVTISRDSVEADGNALNLEVGAKYTAEDLLYAIMLTSANDAAIALAEYVGGDIESFVQMMNTKASELNLKDTHFSNPTGLFDETQYTTAYDLSMLVRYALSGTPKSVFNEVFSTRVKLWVNQKGDSQVLKSQNELFWSYDGVDGGKIGFNDKNLQGSVTTATRRDQRLICIVLDSPEKYVFTDTTSLLDYGFYSFKKDILVSRNKIHKTIMVGEEKVNLINISDVYYTHPIGDSYIKDAILSNVPDTLEPPISKSHIVGTVRYILHDGTTVDISLYPDKEIQPPEDFYTKVYNKIAENRDILVLVMILIGIEAIILIYKLIKLFRRKLVKPSVIEKK